MISKPDLMQSSWVSMRMRELCMLEFVKISPASCGSSFDSRISQLSVHDRLTSYFQNLKVSAVLAIPGWEVFYPLGRVSSDFCNLNGGFLSFLSKKLRPKPHLGKIGKSLMFVVTHCSIINSENIIEKLIIFMGKAVRLSGIS